MALTVEGIISRARNSLLESGEDGARWPNVELLGLLNEAYESICALRPDSSTVNTDFPLTAAQSKQQLPVGAVRLIDIISNTAELSDGESIDQIDRNDLDQLIPAWHRSTPTLNIENFVYDEADPLTFYVYPRPDTGATIEMIYSAVPTPHDTADYAAVKDDAIKVADQFAPALHDYLLYRAFLKDADNVNNAQRSAQAFNAYASQLGIKADIAAKLSPNYRKTHEAMQR